MTNSTNPRVLVTAGSKHGATEEIARRIAQRMSHDSCEVEWCAPDDADGLEGYDAIVLGSAVYAGRWTPDAMELARRIAALEHKPPVWIFSSGPVGDPPHPEEEPVDVSEALALTEARQHHVFAGKIDKSKLNFGEKAILLAVRAPEGDFRDWDAIDRWAGDIAASLTRETSKS